MIRSLTRLTRAEVMVNLLGVQDDAGDLSGRSTSSSPKIATAIASGDGQMHVVVFSRRN